MVLRLEMIRWLALGVVVSACLPPGPSEARTWYVTPSGTGDAPTIQAAVDSAATGDVILLASGIYTGTGNRDIELRGKELAIRSENGAEATELDCQGTIDEPHRGFFIHESEGPSTIIEGLAIRGGVQYMGYGGAMSIFRASPTVRNCRFADNVVGLHDDKSGCGGAIALSDAMPRFESCQFIGNVAWAGGGAVCSGSSAPAFHDCVFESNVALLGGAGAMLVDRGAVTLANCAFVDNNVGSAGGGGAISCNDASMELTGCVLRGNYTRDPDAGVGAAIAVGYSPNLSVSECVFDSNKATSWLGGGAFYIYGSTGTVENCTFARNIAPVGSGMTIRNSDVTIERTIIAFGEDGEAITCGGPTTLAITCCDFVGNDGGDWIGCTASFYGEDGNFWRDPFFCDLESGDLTLHGGSPCLPGYHPQGADCGLIGALGEGCSPTHTQGASWGQLKHLFDATSPPR